MNQLVPISSPTLPVLGVAAGERASMRFLEFFAANIGRGPLSSQVGLILRVYKKGAPSSALFQAAKLFT
jgi:hypothetical protein